ncbi:MAG: lysozyme family protein [Butyricicoccus sp.]
MLAHQPMVEKYARQNGISNYVYVLLAIIQVESEASWRTLCSPRNCRTAGEYARHRGQYQAGM